MANFVVVVDPDVKRRSRFIKVIEPLLALVDGLKIAMCTKGDFCAIWAGTEAAPVSQVVANDGAAVLWGEAIDGPEGRRITAIELKQLSKTQKGSGMGVFDGFYAAVVYHEHCGIIVGADLLGLFPIYYFAAGEVLLVGSSPELFKHHPAFRLEFSPRGLVGILLTMHIVHGQTLLHSVKRLATGHILSWSERLGPKEIEVYKVPVSTRYLDLPFATHVDLLDRLLEQTIIRHAPYERSYAILLSGGLDSRMLAGYLRRKGISCRAVTRGLPSDIDMKCAIPVARTLCLEHYTLNIPDEQFPIYADLQAQWEHVANGFNSIMQWGEHSHLRRVGPRVITGLLMDSIVGGSHLNWAYSSESNVSSFDIFFSRINSYGIEKDILKRLLRHEIFGDLIEETVAQIKRTYESYAELESQRAWCFDLYHRQRFHVGSEAWAISFGAWPVLPVLTQALLESVGGMPAATLAGRRAQNELLCTRFPELAALPLDRNSYNTAPLQPRLRWLVRRYLLEHLRNRVGCFRNANTQHTGQYLYYYRTYDLNGPGWRAVRQLAESHRERVLHLFNKEVLDTLLPSPEVPLRLKDGIITASGLKSLLGFLLWSRHYLT